MKPKKANGKPGTKAAAKPGPKAAAKAAAKPASKASGKAGKKKGSSLGLCNDAPCLRERAQATGGGAVFVIVLAILSILTVMDFRTGARLYVAGEIAAQDITAAQDILVEDQLSTLKKRQEVADAQPPVYDLSPVPFSVIERRVREMFESIRRTAPEEMEQLRWQIAESLNTEISKQSFNIWRDEDIQNMILGRVMPWLGDRFQKGVVGDRAVFGQYENGIVVRDVDRKVEALRLDLAGVDDISALREALGQFLRDDLNKPLRTRKAVQSLLQPMLEPSMTLNDDATRARRKEVMSAVEPVYYQIKRGEVVVRQGERVTPGDQFKLQALLREQKDEFPVIGAVGVFVLSLMFSGTLVFSPKNKLISPLPSRDFLLLATFLLFFGGLSKGLAYLEVPLESGLSVLSGNVLPFCLPIGAASGLLALFFSRWVCFGGSLVLSYVCAAMFGNDAGIFAFYFITCLISVTLMKRTETRQDVIRAIIPLTGGMLLTFVGVSLAEVRDFSSLGFESLFILGNGLFSLLAIMGLNPVVDLVFGYTSRFRLMELMNLESPLLQELMVTVPGTYHHSLVVSNMVEAGARAIGAKALLCKVAALYHDIGKLKNPQYFIENQFKGNPHNKLSPSMSALILINHVKKGVELARQHKLGTRIIELIPQHHGTSVISYFYHKAKEQAQERGESEVRMEDFRYPGPKPQSREAAIIMLADAVEASSRTLQDPTPSRIRGHIDTIFHRIMDDGQLDESELTFKDMHLLAGVFERILNGIFHSRIQYPSEQKEREAGREGTNGNANGQANGKKGGKSSEPKSKGKGKNNPPLNTEPASGKSQEETPETVTLPAGKVVQ